MAESRVTVSKREYDHLNGSAILLGVLFEEGLMDWDGYHKALNKLREIAGEPVLESTVNTPLIGENTDQ